MAVCFFPRWKGLWGCDKGWGLVLQDGEAIDLAFNKKRADDRKDREELVVRGGLDMFGRGGDPRESHRQVSEKNIKHQEKNSKQPLVLVFLAFGPFGQRRVSSGLGTPPFGVALGYDSLTPGLGLGGQGLQGLWGLRAYGMYQ